jgi:hypothetical protein
MKGLGALVVLVGCLVAMLILSQEAKAQPPSGVGGNDALTALQYYLDADCAVVEKKDEPGPLGELLKYKADPALQAKLTDLLFTGPDKDSVQRSKQSLEQQWNIRKVLVDKATRPPTPQDKESFISQRLERQRRVYRHKAAIALAVIGSKEAIETLQRASKSDDKELGSLAKLVLARYKKPAKKT